MTFSLLDSAWGRDYTGSMNVLKTSTQLFNQVVDLYRIRDERQRRDRIIAGVIVFAVLAVLFYFSIT